MGRDYRGFFAVGTFAMALIGCQGVYGGISRSTGPPTAVEQSARRLYSLGLAMRSYVSDYDDFFPNTRWADSLNPYVADKNWLTSPALSSGYGYAFNSDLVAANTNIVGHEETTIMFFDSTDVSYSAVGPTTTMPNPPRYGSQNTWVYMDGHTSPVYSPPGPAVIDRSLSNLRACATAFTLYESDNDSRTPLVNTWMDATSPYLGSEQYFHDPALAPTDFGYAVRPEVCGISAWEARNPVEIPLEFDSTVNARNATAGLDTLPRQGRYNGLNVMSFLDGHAKVHKGL